jgi:type I restriction enzyme S subunit
MDAQQFLSEFGHIANAPGGVGKLRELVLQLAISGRLTERVADDTSALELIEANKNRQKTLVAQKVLKRQPAPRPVKASDQPWILPEGWAWTRLGSVTNYGDAPKIEFEDVKDDTWVLELEDIEKGTSKLLSKVFARERKFKSTKNGFPSGAVLYGKLRPYLDKVLIADSAGVCTTEISPITFFENIDAGYLRWYLKSPYFIAYADGSTYGMNLPRLGTDSAREALFAFPPRREQSRIVAKVDELMALCDKLEAQQQERRKLQNNLRQSTLQAVANANSPHELQTAWTRLADNFGKLFLMEEDLIDLNQCIKHLALKGLLTVAQPGETIPSRITDLTINPSSAVTETEMDWPIPKHWVWARCAWLGDARLGKMLDAAKNKGELRPYLRNINVRWGKFDLTDLLKMRVEEHELPRVSVRKGDLVICEGGEPGRAAIWEREEEFVIQKALHRFRCNEALLPEYFLFCLEHDFWSGRLSRYYTGATIKHLTGRALCEYSIPLPPVEEQMRILSAANCLTDSVANLGGNLMASTRIAEALAIAAVSSLSSNTSEPGVEHSDFKPQLETAE